MSSLQIHSERALMEINVTNAQMHITRTWPKMTINNVPAKMRIERQMTTFKVNWAARNNEQQRSHQQKPVLLFSGNQHSEAYQKTMQAVAHGVQEGEKSGKFHGARRAQGSRNHSMRAMQENMPEIDIEKMRQNTPSMEWDPGFVKVDWDKHSLAIEWDIQSPQIDVDPYSVEILLRNRPRVRVTFDPEGIEGLPGHRVDKKI